MPSGLKAAPTPIPAGGLKTILPLATSITLSRSFLAAAVKGSNGEPLRRSVRAAAIRRPSGLNAIEPTLSSTLPRSRRSLPVDASQSEMIPDRSPIATVTPSGLRSPATKYRLLPASYEVILASGFLVAMSQMTAPRCRCLRKPLSASRRG